MTQTQRVLLLYYAMIIHVDLLLLSLPSVVLLITYMYYVRHHVLNSAWALYGHLMKCIEIDMHRRKAGFLYRIAATSVNSSSSHGTI